MTFSRMSLLPKPGTCWTVQEVKPLLCPANMGRSSPNTAAAVRTTCAGMLLHQGKQDTAASPQKWARHSACVDTVLIGARRGGHKVHIDSAALMSSSMAPQAQGTYLLSTGVSFLLNARVLIAMTRAAGQPRGTLSLDQEQPTPTLASCLLAGLYWNCSCQLGCAQGLLVADALPSCSSGQSEGLGSPAQAALTQMLQGIISPAACLFCALLVTCSAVTPT